MCQRNSEQSGLLQCWAKTLPLCQSQSSHILNISDLFLSSFLHKCVFAKIGISTKCKDLLAAVSSLLPRCSSSTALNLSLEPVAQVLMVF